MSDTPPEPLFPETPDGLLSQAIVGFIGCIGEALVGICSYSWTIGESYIPFLPDDVDECEDDEEACAQAWVRVTSITPSSTSVESFSGNECALDLSIGLEVGILRCYEIPEDGEAPLASEVLAAGIQSMTDMNAILCAALGCEVWSSLTVGSWAPESVLGGQYGGTWVFTAEV